MQHNYQITRIMNEVVNEIKNDFRTAHYQEEAERIYNKMKLKKNTSAYPYRKKELLALFRDSGLPCDENMSDKEIEELISKLPTPEGIEPLLLEKLHKVYKEFPVSSNYMERIVRRLGDQDLKNETVRVAIVKQFLRHTDYETGNFKRGQGKVIDLIKSIKGDDALEKAEKSLDIPDKYKRCREAVVSCFDESVFNAYINGYDSLNKAGRKEYNKKYALLKLADGLANGNFWMNFGTRRDLYLFAMAFNMKAYPDKNVDDYDEILDIEKNLFFDFYADNLLRFLKEKPGTEEKEPTGESINYKNFAEIIYLYYLNNQDLAAGEKIRRAERKIEECIEKAMVNKEKNCKNESDGTKDTNTYKEECFYEVSKLEDAQLADYIVSHYVIPTDIKTRSPISVESEEVAATRIFKALRRDLDSKLNEDQSLLSNILEWFTYSEKDEKNSSRTKFIRTLDDMNDSLGEGLNMGIGVRNIRQYLLELARINEKDNPDFIKIVEDNDFIKILNVLDARLKLGNDDILQGKERVSRTRLIALHYLNYAFEIKEGTDAESREFVGEGKSLSDLYDDFVSRVDPDLEESRYQVISPKNIFDMFVICMLYRHAIM